MPRLLDTRPSWSKPETASVMDSGPVKATRKIMQLMGLDTPEGQVLSAAMPTPLVSIFKDKAARELGTQAYRKASQYGFLPSMQKALGDFADKYPRIAAHITPGNSTTMDAGHYASTMVPHGKVASPIPIIYNRTDQLLDRVKQAKNTVFHEGTHAAQALGNKDFNKLYQNAESIVGYENNPFEITARAAGERAMHGPTSMPVENAIDMLKRIALDRKIQASQEGTYPSAANSILGTIKRRVK